MAARGKFSMKRAPVELTEYDPGWPAKFEAEKSILMETIGEWFFGRVEHVGSTAVPGLVAKPIIDIMFGVKSLEASRPAIDVRVRNGYEYSPYKTAVMYWFCKPSDAFRTHHLHLIPFASLLWHERIKFHDLLRLDPALANEYAALKKQLTARYRQDRETYTEQNCPLSNVSLNAARSASGRLRASSKTGG